MNIQKEGNPTTRLDMKREHLEETAKADAKIKKMKDDSYKEVTKLKTLQDKEESEDDDYEDD